MKNNLIKTVCPIIIFPFVLIESISGESQNTNKVSSIYEKELMHVYKRIRTVTDKLKAPYYFNKKTGKVDKVLTFSIFLKSLSNIEYYGGEMIREQLKCKMKFSDNDKLGLIIFAGIRIKEKSGLRQIRNIINDNPLSENIDNLKMEFKDYDFEKMPDGDNDALKVSRVGDVEDVQTKLKIANIYVKWLEDVEYRLWKISTNALMRLKYKDLHVFDL
ncbi:MAG: hypothetical protein SVZ03_01630 [Spirochaetota bacterium]|nr:hypothetical protein [Spirochaetota bacterium]